MLAISRKPGEVVRVDARDSTGRKVGELFVHVVKVNGNKVRLAFDGARELFQITRDELNASQSTKGGKS